MISVSIICFILEGDRSHLIPSNEVRGCVGRLLRVNRLKGSMGSCQPAERCMFSVRFATPNSPGALDTSISQLGSAQDPLHGTAPSRTSPDASKGNVMLSGHATFENIWRAWRRVPTSFGDLGNLSEEPKVTKDASIGQQCPSSWGKRMAQRAL